MCVRLTISVVKRDGMAISIHSALLMINLVAQNTLEEVHVHVYHGLDRILHCIRDQYL